MTDYSLRLVAASSQYATVADNALLDLGDLFTLSIGGVKFASAPTAGGVYTLIGKHDPPAAQRSYVWFVQESAGNYNVGLSVAGNGAGTLLFAVTWAGIALPADSFEEWSVAYDKAGGGAEFLIGGVSQGEKTATTHTPFDSTAAFAIGSRSDGANYFDGWLHDVMVDKAGTVVANWSLNNTLEDASGNNLTLTAQGGATFEER